MRKKGLAEQGQDNRISGLLGKGASRIKLAWYNFTVRAFGNRRTSPSPKKKRINSKKVFFYLLLAFPLVQFAIMYVGVNINSILLAFKSLDLDTWKFAYTGFDNFKGFFADVSKDYITRISIFNSLKLYGVGLIIGIPINLIFSYFLYKKVKFSEFFRVVLFLPQIVSPIVMTIMFKFFVDRALPEIMSRMGLAAISYIAEPSTAFGAIVFFCVWSSFGTQILVYTSSMSRIPDSLIEYGRLEGLSMLREFWSITLPLIFPTITTFIVVGVAGIFSNQAALFNFYGADAEYHMYTLGYLFFIKVASGGERAQIAYPYASAAGLVFTAIAAPLTLGVKYLLEKFGPNPEF